MNAGICLDGPWEGRFLTAESDFVAVPSPWGGAVLGEYCFDGVRNWNWFKWEATK